MSVLYYDARCYKSYGYLFISLFFISIFTYIIVDSACGDLERSNASGISVTSQTNQNCEYSFVFTNVGGQAVLLSMPQLRRMDTLHLLDSHDVVAVSSVVFSQPGSINVNTSCYVPGPALGLYQLAPGQVCIHSVNSYYFMACDLSLRHCESM